MFRLAIAEKPSVAMSIAAVLGATTKKDGYVQGNGWLVSWCFGHLAQLADAGSYAPQYAKWRHEDLPILPHPWQFAVGKDKQGQFDTLKRLMCREDVAEVVNACDAGREGELIFRTVYDLSGCAKPMRRLWISSMEDEAIREGFAALKDGREYDGLHQSALCRAKADWLVGINATRLFSLLYSHTLNVGRVLSPTLALIVEREAQISAFRSEPFYTVALDCGGLTATGERQKARKEAEAVAAACEGQTATLKAVEQKERTEKPPALYDLTTLQRDANRALGYTAQQTLDYLQALYEKKLCTYPRTDSRYLTNDMEAGVPALAAVAAAICGAQVPESCNAAQVCDSTKVSDHHAVVPTAMAGKTDLAALPEGEREILGLVARGLLKSVSPAHRFAETSVTVECGGYPFTAKGRTVLAPGWKAYAQERADKPEGGRLPEGLKEGQPLPVAGVSVREGQTTAPKHYTEDSLLAAMETAGAKDMPEEAERRGLGTPATRAATLEKLVSTGFVERKKAKKTVNLLPTQIGVSLITVLPKQLQSPQLTAQWEHRLKEIEQGTLDPGHFMDGIAAMLKELVETCKAVDGAGALFPSDREAVGKCPRCGGTVAEGKKGFFCENRDCRFALWKDSRFFAAKKKTLTKTVAASLLKDGQVKLTGCHSEKTGKTYDATVVLEDDGGKFVNFRLEFDRKDKKK